MVYRVRYSEDGTLQGYLNFTLSYFNPDNFEYRQQEYKDQLDDEDGEWKNVDAAAAEGDPDFCRYHDYRYHPGDCKYSSIQVQYVETQITSLAP